MKGLIVTADDFGAAVEVNEAVERAHRDGILTAASLMVGAPAFGDAVARARRLPSLRVGLHLVLVDGRPVLPGETIPDLVGSDGDFRRDMARAAARMFFRAGVRDQLRREVRAQFERFAASGLKLDHVNAHKHFHLHPTIADAIIAVGRDFDMRSVRVPLEPTRILSEVDKAAAPRFDALSVLARAVKRKFRRSGSMTPDYVFGLAWSGAMVGDRLGGLIANLPEGLSEIYLHPATRDAFPGSAPGYRYCDELAALLDDATMAAARKSDIRLGGFADFPPVAKIQRRRHL